MANYTATHIIKENTPSVIQPSSMQFIVYNTGGINVTTTTQFKNTTATNYAGNITTYMNLDGKYLIRSANNADINLALADVPYQYGSYFYNISILGSNSGITSHSTFNHVTLTAQTANVVNIFLAPDISTGNSFCPPNSYLLISNGIGAYTNSCGSNIFNYSSFYFLIGGAVFFQPSYAGHNYQYQLIMNFPNNPASAFYSSPLNTYYLIPQYTTNYTAGNFIKISNPTSINITNSSLDTVKGWYYDFNYRIPINVNTWNYSFTTYAYAPTSSNTVFLGTAHVYKVPNSPYLYLNLTHYAEMGSGCFGNVYFRDYNNITGNDYGSVPFAILNCNPTNTTATFILSNKTSGGYTYNSLYVYFGSRSGFAGVFNNQNILNNFSTSYKGGAVVSYSSPPKINYLLTLTSGFLNPSSYLTIFDVNLTGQSSSRTTIKSTGGERIGSIVNTQFLAQWVNTTIVGRDIYGVNYGNCVTLANDTNVIGDCDTGLVGTSFILNLTSGINSTLSRLYTTNYSLGHLEYYPNPNGANVILPIVPPENLNGSNAVINTSTVTGLNLSVLNSKKTLQNEGLDLNINFFGVILPEYYLLVIQVITIIVGIGLSEAEHSEAPVLLSLLIIWIVGIFAVSQLLIAVLLTLVYIVYHYIDTHREDDNRE